MGNAKCDTTVKKIYTVSSCIMKSIAYERGDLFV